MPETYAFIPMRDGARMHAKLYVPEGEGKFPAVLEALPYRKDDVTVYYEDEYRRLGSEGRIAVCRVDVRGTGTSEGIAEDEYLPVEQDDMCDVIAWLASRDWCNGSVGMYGTSYSGFNALQVAMRRPPALKAIISIFATDSRYTDDVHYGGGVLRGVDVVDYPTYMIAMNALPPVPELYGDGWREEWQRRLDGLEPWIINWMEHQNEDDYWLQGSLKADYSAITCPVFVISGWADGYHNMAMRTYENLEAPAKVLIGPWSHMSTESSIPGPHIDLVPEMIRWWNRWLREDEGASSEAPIQVFMRRPTKPEPDLAEQRGEWRSEPAWPIARAKEATYELGEGPEVIEIRGDVGSSASIWCAGTLPWGPPMDQRTDEPYSLVVDLTEQLEDEIEIFGTPRLEATITSSVPVAYLSAKLCDAFPDGTSALVSRGILNLTHRDGHGKPEPVEPGRTYDVVVELDLTGWIFERGHRIRLDLAGADWPSSWAPPMAGTIRIDRRRSRLVLPELNGEPIAEPPSFSPPRQSLEGRAGEESDPHDGVEWRIERDYLRRETKVVARFGTKHDAQDETYGGEITVSTTDPGNSECRAVGAFSIPADGVQTRADVVLRSDRSNYFLDIRLEVVEGGKPKMSRKWERTFPRDLQ